MEQEIGTARTELGDKWKGTAFKCHSEGLGTRVSTFLVLGQGHRGGLGVELKGHALISGFWEPDL